MELLREYIIHKIMTAFKRVHCYEEWIEVYCHFLITKVPNFQCTFYRSEIEVTKILNMNYTGIDLNSTQNYHQIN